METSQEVLDRVARRFGVRGQEDAVHSGTFGDARSHVEASVGGAAGGILLGHLLLAPEPVLVHHVSQTVDGHGDRVEEEHLGLKLDHQAVFVVEEEHLGQVDPVLDGEPVELLLLRVVQLEGAVLQHRPVLLLHVDPPPA